MIFDPDYAEMHYRFKLPWSLLYKKEPEVILDAPFAVIPGENVRIFIVIREADRFPVTLKSFESVFKKEGETFRKSLVIEKKIEEPFCFMPVDCGKLPPGDYTVEASVELQSGTRTKKISRFNLSGLKRTPLRMRVLGEAYPKPEGFISGDVHAHTYYSADPVEFGASPEVLQAAAKSLGLDFVFCTDHSYDFGFSRENYMQRTNAEARYAALQEEIASLEPYPKLIAGEEVSAGNAQGKNVHMLLPGSPRYVPGEGDCGRNWLRNAPTLSIRRIAEASGLPCLAAHPKEAIGRLERFVFRRGDWESEDLQKGKRNPVRGLEFWNGARDKGFTLGRKFWISELERGNFLLPLGGNDAHGDLNEYTGVKIPLLKLKRSMDHVFGKVRTVIEGKDPVCALNGNRLFVTDGPALWWTERADALEFRFKSAEDFGALKRLVILAQKTGSPHEETLPEKFERTSPYEAVCRIPTRGLQYVRAEAETETGRFALTSAFPVKRDNARKETSQPDFSHR